MKYVKWFLGLLLVQLVIGVMVYIIFPAHRFLLVGEDQLVENLSALFFFASGLLGIGLFVRRTDIEGRGIFLLVAALGWVGFLDEVSFGERLFELPMPVLLGKKIDGVHDLVDVGWRLIQKGRREPSLVVAIVSAGAIGGITVAVLSFRTRIQKVVSAMLQRAPYHAVVVFAVLLGAALCLDTDFFDFEMKMLFEELFEMNAALALILVCLCALQQRVTARVDTNQGIKAEAGLP